MSRHIPRTERWKKGDRIEEYFSDDGVVHKDRYGGKTWVGLVKEGFGLKVVGRSFTRARNAMIAVEEAAEKIRRGIKTLPPIHIQAHIYDTI